MKKIIKKSNALAFAAVAAMIAAAPGAVGQAGKPKPARVSIWSFSKEAEQLLNAYKKMAVVDESKVQFEFILIDNKDYQSRLDAALKSKKGGPDVFVLEAAYLGKYVESGRLADLSSLAPGYSGSFPYTVRMGTDRDGTVRALSWHAVPGGFFYRRSLAKKYFGTDDPAAVQERIATPDAFIEAARELARASSGKVAMICSAQDLFNPFKGARDVGWLDGNKLVIDPMMVELARITRIFRDEALDPRIQMWTNGWFEGMKGAVYGTRRESVEIFGYFLPTWGLHYVLKPNAKGHLGSSTVGDWGLARGPVPYSWGGNWLAASGGEGEDASEALKFIEYCCTNGEFQAAWAKETGDVVACQKAADEAKERYSEPFLGGQNHYAAFAEMARSMKGGNLSARDEEIDGAWQYQMKLFIQEKQSEETFIQDFRSELARAFRGTLRGIDVR